MLNKKSWYVVQVKDENGKMYAWAHSVPDWNNLLSELNRIKDVISVNHCPTKKEACAIAEDWNTCAKRNGNYMFADIF